MKLLLALVLSSLFFMTSCTTEPSLQKYFVENSESNDFITVDLSPSLLQINESQLTPEQKASIATVKKMNIIAFKANDSNQNKFEAESQKVKQILKNTTYQELMKFNTGDGGASVYFVGKENKIDEFILFGNEKKNGFAIVRLLGKDMNPSQFMDILEVIKKSNIDQEQLKPLKALFEKQ